MMTFLPDLPTLATFALASLVLAVTPGPDMTLFLGRTLAEGRRAGLAAMLGAATGLLVHISLAAFGISALIAASPTAFLVLKIAGAVYLIFLAIQAIRTGSALRVENRTGERPARTTRDHWLTGIGINLLNPKTILFFMTFLPQFAEPGDADVAARLLFLGLVFMVIALPISVAMILCADALARGVARHPKLMRGIDWLFAGVFSAFAVRILLTPGR